VISSASLSSGSDRVPRGSDHPIDEATVVQIAVIVIDVAVAFRELLPRLAARKCESCGKSFMPKRSDAGSSRRGPGSEGKAFC
jgi:hypothetical protein